MSRRRAHWQPHISPTDTELHLVRFGQVVDDTEPDDLITDAEWGGLLRSALWAVGSALLVIVAWNAGRVLLGLTP